MTLRTIRYLINHLQLVCSIGQYHLDQKSPSKLSMVGPDDHQASHCCALDHFSLGLLFIQDEMTSLPMLSVPHDSFRHGLGTLKDDIGNTHVVEAIQRNVSMQAA